MSGKHGKDSAARARYSPSVYGRGFRCRIGGLRTTLGVVELRTEIEILAPPAAVWGVLVDFLRFPDWNPFIPFISGELQIDARLEVLFALPDGSEVTIRPRVLAVVREQELRWIGHFFLRGLFDGEHFFRLVEIAPGRTRFVHGENFSGILLKPMTGRVTNMARGFVFMNQALKRRVESLR